MHTVKNNLKSGFTLVEMMVIAPIVILLIGAFIALIVNLTGEVLSSRGSNVLAYDVQDALNRIEQDVKLSTTYLSTNNIDIDGNVAPPVAATRQGYARNAGEVSGGSTVNFSNVAKTNGSNASLILNVLATNDNPLSDTANYVYLANQPNSCSTIAEYSKNTPMSTNVIYFVDSNETLWRRTIMPTGYDVAANRCGNAPWQQPSCAPGYNTASVPFCKTNDIKLVEGVRAADFQVSYYTSASGTAATSAANNPADTTANGDAVRNAALQSTPTVSVSIISRKTIAGREISQSGTVRATRLDTNASSIATQTPVTAAPTAPRVSSNVSDGHYVNFIWPRVDTATSYDLDYRINGGAWQAGGTDLDNNSRQFTVSTAWHEDTVEVRVRATNSAGDSAWTTNSLKIPLWAPLILRGGWTDYAAGYGTAAYTMTKSGLVMLKGLVRNSGSPAVGDIIGVLPNDYKPSGRLLIGTSSSTNGNGSARVDVNPIAEGAQVVFSDSGSPGWFTLDSVRFVPAISANTKVTPTLQNSFIPYGGAYEGPTYTQDTTFGTNRVTIQGLLNNGNRANGVLIFTIPAALRPAKYQHHASRSGTFHHLGIDENAGLLAKGDGSGAYAINMSYLPASVTGWTNLSMVNGWVYYPDGPNWFSTPQYNKTSDGIVQLKGLIRGGSTTYDSNIATLPVGFRPKARILTTVVNSGGYARIDILANGEIHFMGSSNTWYALDSVYFMAEQ